MRRTRSEEEKAKEEISKAYFRYVKKHKITQPWNQDNLDPTGSFVMKGKKVLGKNIVRTGYSQGEHYFWTGWYTRLERLARLYHQAEKASNKYYKEVFWPLIQAAWKGRRPRAEERVLYYMKDGDLRKISIHNSHEYGLSYSLGDGLTREEEDQKTRLCQFPQWEDKYEGINNPVEALEIVKAEKTYSEKRQRAYLVQGLFFMVITNKLKEIADDHKGNEIIEFVLDGEKFRYQRKHKFDRDAFEYWTRISGNDIQTVDITKILPKYVY